MIIVYAIKSLKRNYIYVGMTDDIKRRFNQHQKGYEKATRPSRPFRLIHQEVQEYRETVRERYLYQPVGNGFYSLFKRNTDSSFSWYLKPRKVISYKAIFVDLIMYPFYNEIISLGLLDS